MCSPRSSSRSARSTSSPMRSSGDALLQGVGAAAGAGGFRLRRARQVGHQRRHVRRLPARARRSRRRRDAQAHAPHRAAHPPRGADQPDHRSEDRPRPRRSPMPRWPRAGMFLVDEAGRIVHANASGHAMLHESSVLRAAGGRLVAIEASAATALNEIFPVAGHGDAAVGTKGIAVPLRARDGEHYVAHVLPLTSGARRRAGDELCGRRRAVRAQGGDGGPLAAGGHRQALQPDAERAARAARHRAGGRRAGDGRGARRGRGDRQDAPAPPVRQDRRQPPGRPRQAGGRVCQPSRERTPDFAPQTTIIRSMDAPWLGAAAG